MQITFDPVKNERNIRERGLPFEWAAQFDFEGALYSFTETADGIRIISFRKANEREVKRHAQSHAAD